MSRPAACIKFEVYRNIGMYLISRVRGFTAGELLRGEQGIKGYIDRIYRELLKVNLKTGHRR